MEKLCVFVLLYGVIASVLSAIPKDDGPQTAASGTCNGASAADGDTVTVEYEGAFENGTVFDSSLLRNKSLTFDLGDADVIKDWNVGLQGACVNDEVQIKISSLPDPGEGVTFPPSIPPNTDLTFTAHVMAVVKKANASLSGNRTADQIPNSMDSESDEDGDPDDPNAVSSAIGTSSDSIWYKLQFLAIPVAVILLILVAYCIYTVEYPDRKIRFYRVSDHESDGGLNRVVL